LPGGGQTIKLMAMKHQLDFEKPIVELQHQLDELKKHPETLGISFDEEVARMEKKLEETKRQIFLNLSAWDRVKIARHPKRPFTLDYLGSAFTDFSELHGDRLFSSGGSRASANMKWWPSGLKRGATPRKTSSGTSGLRTRKAIAKHCG